MVNASTTVCGLLGYPVEHSFSPLMHNSAFQAIGLNWVYLPFKVHPQNLSQAVKAVSALNMAGVNITVPHKEAVLPYLHRLSTAAQAIGAVNVIVHKEGQLIGHNTDGEGFVMALQQGVGFNVHDKNAVILGAGGAARAVAVQLALEGIKGLVIVNRTLPRAQDIAQKVNNLGVKAQALAWDEQALRPILDEAHLVVQATSIGMHPQAHRSVAWPDNYFRAGQVVCDLVYNPVDTVFLQRASKAGARTVSGLGMLLYQGVLAFELWTNRQAPVEVMKRVIYGRMEG